MLVGIFKGKIIEVNRIDSKTLKLKINIKNGKYFYDMDFIIYLTKDILQPGQIIKGSFEPIIVDEKQTNLIEGFKILN